MTRTPLVCLGALLAGSAFAATIPTGPPVGAKAFDFQLKDQKGEPRDLASVMGPKGAIVIFYRSSDW